MDCESRINAISLLHDLLFKSDNIDYTDLRSYITNIAKYMLIEFPTIKFMIVGVNSELKLENSTFFKRINDDIQVYLM